MRASSSTSSGVAAGADSLRFVPGNLNSLFRWEPKKLNASGGTDASGAFGSVHKGVLTRDMEGWKKGTVFAIKIMHRVAVEKALKMVHHVRVWRGGLSCSQHLFGELSAVASLYRLSRQQKSNHNSARNLLFGRSPEMPYAAMPGAASAIFVSARSRTPAALSLRALLPLPDDAAAATAAADAASSSHPVCRAAACPSLQ